mgnify:CR=1 FL=1
MLKNLLKITVFTGLAALGITALVRSKLLPDLRKKFHDFDVEYEKNNCIKRRLQIIADVMKRRMSETECRISEENHRKKQEEYDKMNWDEKIVSRKDF